MNFLCTDADVVLTDLWSHSFGWGLIDELPDSRFEQIRMGMTRERLSEGRGWGKWKANKTQTEAALGLRIVRDSSTETNHRVIGIDDPSAGTTYEQWVQPDVLGKIITTINSRHHEHDALVLGKPTTPTASGTSNGAKFQLTVYKPANGSPTTLGITCGQFQFSTFISHIAKTVLGSSDGVVRRRVNINPNGMHMNAALIFEHRVVDELVTRVQQTGLATVEEAIFCVLPPLGKSGKLPETPIQHPADSPQNVAKEITAYIEDRQLQQAEGPIATHDTASS
ncbi:hypothetical protein K440DRAFT_645566 [Wilcoxina mikolae CBS 423.85]|nr:hypothetical protein K440DRAFT_645566 [Wilcoxina mikolae CBS 423.85]